MEGHRRFIKSSRATLFSNSQAFKSICQQVNHNGGEGGFYYHFYIYLFTNKTTFKTFLFLRIIGIFRNLFLNLKILTTYKRKGFILRSHYGDVQLNGICSYLEWKGKKRKEYVNKVSVWHVWLFYFKSLFYSFFLNPSLTKLNWTYVDCLNFKVLWFVVRDSNLNHLYGWLDV